MIALRVQIRNAIAVVQQVVNADRECRVPGESYAFDRVESEVRRHFAIAADRLTVGRRESRTVLAVDGQPAAVPVVTQKAASGVPVLVVIGCRPTLRRSETRCQQLRFTAGIHRARVRQRKVRTPAG